MINNVTLTLSVSDITRGLLDSIIDLHAMDEKHTKHWFREKCNSICKSAHEQIIANA
jgi:hypothetical protein